MRAFWRRWQAKRNSRQGNSIIVFVPMPGSRNVELTYCYKNGKRVRYLDVASDPLTVRVSV